MRIGQYLEDSGIRLLIDDKVDGLWILRNVNSNETRTVGDQFLIDAIHKCQLSLPEHVSQRISDPNLLSSSERGRINARQESSIAVRQMLEKRAWIDGLRAKGIDKIVDEAWVRSAIDHLARGELSGLKRYAISTLADAARLLEKANGDWSQLVPHFSGRGGPGIARIDSRADRVINQVIQEIKADPKRRIVKEDIYTSVIDEINSINLGSPDGPIAVPGNTTMARRISEQFSAMEILARNTSSKHARKINRENSYPRDVAEFPLLISEYDDLNTENFLIDGTNGLPFGRAFLTQGVDQNTRVPLGFDFSHEPRSYDSGMGALLDSLLPKDLSRPEFQGCKHPWIGYGNQGMPLLDNASYNFSKSMELRTNDLQMLLAGARPYGPTEKCAIEHHNAITLTDFCAKQPGYCGSKDDDDRTKNGMNSAACTVADFKSNYVKWITGEFLNKPGIDGWTPKQRWERHFKNHGPAVRWSREQVALFRLRPRLLRFRASGGIKRLNLVYNSKELMVLRKRLGASAQAMVHIDRHDLTYIKVTDPYTNKLIHVPCTTSHRYVSGLTEYQQVLILKTARQRGRKNPSLGEMIEARVELRDLVNKQMASAKAARRKYAMRVGKIEQLGPELIDPTVDSMPVSKPKIIEQVITNLEFNIIELEKVELELEDDCWELQ